MSRYKVGEFVFVGGGFPDKSFEGKRVLITEVHENFGNQKYSPIYQVRNADLFSTRLGEAWLWKFKMDEAQVGLSYIQKRILRIAAASVVGFKDSIGPLFPGLFSSCCTRMDKAIKENEIVESRDGWVFLPHIPSPASVIILYCPWCGKSL